jgi:hypothetical protein
MTEPARRRQSGWLLLLSGAAVAVMVWAAIPPAAPEFPVLVGKWLRGDGGYILEVRSVSPDGAVQAAYLNPRPIHVSRARASRGEKDALQLFVELRDEGYDGSTYTLTYEPGSDRLAGEYVQRSRAQPGGEAQENLIPAVFTRSK